MIEEIMGTNKIINELDYAANLIYNFKSISKVIVLVNGIFDIIHPGHIAFLEQAKKHGDILIIGVQSDDAIIQYANPYGPINTLENRMKVVGALAEVNYVVPYYEENASNLIGILKPTIFVKAGEYKKGQLPEEAAIIQIDGTIQTVRYIEPFSTKAVLEKIVQVYSQPPTNQTPK